MNKILITAAAGIAIAAAWFAFSTKEKQMLDIRETDPELYALWDSFVNRDVAEHGRVDEKTRYLILLASHIAVQAQGEYEILLEEALAKGVTSMEVREVVYQAVPYAGMAKVYDFLKLTNKVLLRRGEKLPLASGGTTSPADRFENGLAVQKAVFGSQIDDMRKNAPQDQKHIQDFLSANCFGDYYTRSGLDLRTRELLTFAMLVSMGGADNQVKAHIKGNLAVGNDRGVLIDAVTQLLPYIGYPRSLNALAAINDVTE